MSMIRPILGRALRHPLRTAVVDDQGSYSYLKLMMGSLFVAGVIGKTTDREHVGLMLPTSGAFPLALLGTWWLKKVGVPLNYLLKPEELLYVIADSEIDTIVTVSALLDKLDLRKHLPASLKVIELDKQKFKGLPKLRWPPKTYGEEGKREGGTAVVMYTSGTSGKPKGVMLTHANLRAESEGGIEHSGLKDGDTFLGVLPQFHSFGLSVLTLIPLILGAKVVYTARFVPRRIIELIREHRPRIFVGVPSMYAALLSVKSATAEDFESLEIPICGGEPLPDAVCEAYRERLKTRLLEGYGLTETSPGTHWCTPTMKKLHSVGRQLPGVDTRIVDETDKPLGPNEDGEILIAGPLVMKGYFKQPELTAGVMVEIGGTKYFRTGDIGHLDEEGYLFITGRKKEMIIVSGENVFPREIEEVLNRHASVHASAVIGKMDGMRGEVPIAFVEMEADEDHGPAAFDEGVLRGWCRDQLAGYKVPKEIRLVEKLPRNATGKIMRRELEV